MKEKLTLTAKQTLLFFEEFVRKEEVVNFVKELRKELNLPLEGIDFTKEDEEALTGRIEILMYTPERVVKLSQSTNENRALQACNIFTREQSRSSIYISTLLRFYVFFNKTMDLVMKISDHYNDYLRIEYLPSELSGRSKEHFYDHYDAVSKKNPVALLIDPEVSQRQIQDFISHNWTTIRSYREKKPVITYKRKKSKIQERNDFIYQHRDLPRREIMMKVTDKYGPDGVIDYAYVGKIISLERKKREKKC